MATVATFAESFIEDVFKGVHNLPSNTLKVALLNTSYSFDPETHADWSDISSYEITTSGGYSTGGITLTGVSVAATATGGDGVISITCSNNPTWTATSGDIDSTSAAALINTSTSPAKIIMVIDYGATYLTTEGKMFQINLSNGIAQATISLGSGE